MNNEMQVFIFDDNQVRTLNIDGKPYFVGKDVADILGYKDTINALKRHVDEEDKGVREIGTPGGKQDLIVINESGLYSLILSSKMPNAKKFKRWVTSEVLPTIRKHGAYMT
ncbi:MAG: Bro-N domain-containing protein, partial [Lactobacillus iners]|nr:Bro-N domain-containing protein [Lactobacillus iners]